MNIVFITEGNYRGKVNRSHAGRTDQAWIAALNADHCPISQHLEREYDLGIIIPPKNWPDKFTEMFDSYRFSCRTLAVMQEGDARLFWQDRPIWQQADYLALLHKADILYAHNDIDLKYFRGLNPNTDVRILPTLMIEDAIPAGQLQKTTDRSGTMINGNWCSWYGGADSFIIAHEFDGEIYAPQMGRMNPDELRVDAINHIPYTNWKNWIIELSKRKYAVNMMRTIAAASFSLNCAWLSIPCVGWDVQDTQRMCFPELSVPLGDLEQARKVARHLSENDLFYNHCAAYAKKMASDIYSEVEFLKRFLDDFEVNNKK